MNKLVQLSKNLGGVISKNSPSILTGVAVTGLVTTVIFAVKATPKALKIIEAENRILTKKEIVVLTWKEYIPAIGLGIVTIGCIIGANQISTRRNAALAGLYSLTETAFKEYKSKVAETFGKGKEHKIRDEIASDTIKNHPVSKTEVIITGAGETLCYDTMTGRYFKSDIDKIRKVQNKLNRDLMSEMFISLNEFFYELGLGYTRLGEDLGWDIDKGLLEIQFSSQISDNDQPCIVLNYEVTTRH